MVAKNHHDRASQLLGLVTSTRQFTNHNHDEEILLYNYIGPQPQQDIYSL